jgi:hypothetical protein
MSVGYLEKRKNRSYFSARVFLSDAVLRFVGVTNAAPNFEASWDLVPSQKGLVVRGHPEPESDISTL